ncbi:MAG: AAA-like domain-containing protein [Xenococcus sp. MO_188.B8]|nr:AAA-like domain-containing protein [Xenococcus sp. MO_188.B8]
MPELGEAEQNKDYYSNRISPLVMTRSLRIHPSKKQLVKDAVYRNGFARQRDLAENVKLALSTVSNFLNARPVYCLNFFEISMRLGLDPNEISDSSPQSNKISPISETKPKEIESDLSKNQLEAKIFDYVERPPIESRCYETILEPGSLLCIKACEKMGKTSLIHEILDKVGKANFFTVYWSLLLADETVVKGIDKFLRYFCRFVGRELGLPNQLADYWEEDLSSCHNCTIYFEEYLLPQINSPLVLALDNVDKIFDLPFAGAFLMMLRTWYEEAQSNSLWQKLRLIISHSTEVYIPLDINQSPFNVGIPIELPEFNIVQVKELVKRQELNWDTSQLKQLISLVGGHPYLIQQAAYCGKKQPITFEQFLREAPTESGIYSSHLRSHLLNLQEHPELAEAMRKVIKTTKTLQIETLHVFKLQSLGLVIKEDDYVKPRCRLYAQYLQERL